MDKKEESIARLKTLIRCVSNHKPQYPSPQFIKDRYEESAWHFFAEGHAELLLREVSSVGRTAYNLERLSCLIFDATKGKLDTQESHDLAVRLSEEDFFVTGVPRGDVLYVEDKYNL